MESRAPGGFPEFGHGAFDSGAVFGMNQVEARRTDYLLLPIPHDVLKGRTGIANAGVGIADAENVVTILDHLSEVIVQLPQCVVLPFEGGKFAHDAAL